MTKTDIIITINDVDHVKRKELISYLFKNVHTQYTMLNGDLFDIVKKTSKEKSN